LSKPEGKKASPAKHAGIPMGPAHACTATHIYIYIDIAIYIIYIAICIGLNLRAMRCAKPILLLFKPQTY